MAAPLPFSESELRLLRTLLKRKVRFMVVGLSAAPFRALPLSRKTLTFEVLSLERILASKIAANRAKDKLMIPVLRDALAATQTVKRRAKKK